MLNVIREYLVALGFKVDVPSLNTAQHAMDAVEKSVAKFSSSSVKNFAIAGAGVTAFLVAANAGLAKFVSEVGQADLETQIFARRMWMSVDNAKAYQSSMSALGANLQDLYLSPELLQRYLALRNQALSMQMPDNELEPAMKAVRDMTFEFQRLKLEGTYALQWIGYYLSKYVEPILKESGIDIKGINDTIQQKMPQWAEKVAQIASWFVRLGVAAWDARGALVAIMAIFMAPKLIALATNPVFLMIAGLTALLLLLDDYKTYENGGKSAFPELWKSLDDNGTLKNLESDFNGVKDSTLSLIGSIKDLGGELGDLYDKAGGKGGFVGLLTDSFITLLKTLESIVTAISLMAAGIEGIATGDWSNFKSLIDNIRKNNPNSGKSIPQGSGDAWNDAQGMDPRKNKPSPKPIPPGNISGSEWNNLQGIGKTSFGGSSGIVTTSSDGNASWSKRIYDTLNAYLPQIASALGVKMDSKNNPPSFALSSFAQKMNDFFSHNQGLTTVNYSPWTSLYPTQSNTHNANQVSIKPTYNIYGAKDPQTTAKVVDASQNQLMIRTFKGVQQ